jgi:hypothetical protein
VASVGSKGDSYDNAMAESFNGLYKWELIYRQGPWRGLDDVEFATLTYVDWFNHQRLHGEIADDAHSHRRGEHPCAMPRRSGWRGPRSQRATVTPWQVFALTSARPSSRSSQDVSGNGRTPRNSTLSCTRQVLGAP